MTSRGSAPFAEHSRSEAIRLDQRRRSPHLSRQKSWLRGSNPAVSTNGAYGRNVRPSKGWSKENAEGLRHRERTSPTLSTGGTTRAGRLPRCGPCPMKPALIGRGASSPGMSRRGPSQRVEWSAHRGSAQTIRACCVGRIRRRRPIEVADRPFPTWSQRCFRIALRSCSSRAIPIDRFGGSW